MKTSALNELTHEIAYANIKRELPELNGSEWEAKAGQLAAEIQKTIDRWFSIELAESDSERERIREMLDAPDLIFNLEHPPLTSLLEAQVEEELEVV